MLQHSFIFVLKKQIIMKIDITDEIKRFRQFLNTENNDNIIFSGIFGIGKSYFINEFFNDDSNQDYIQVYLTPVNYSVANNEDIFEYIKIDVLTQLLQKIPCEFKHVDISTSVGTYFYLKNNIQSLLSSIFAIAEKVKFGTDITSKLINLKSEIDSFISKNSIHEEKETQDFLNQISIQRGSIYEKNAITQIIQSLIYNAKSKDEPTKKVVLVIDDLDRIDPEHIFRILNILSAHNNFCGTNENKLGFDKTILVCDINNIRNIYKSKYGIDVDFNGYIDKFYSKEVYHFDNTKNIIEHISTIITKIVDFEDKLISRSDTPVHKACVSILSALIRCRGMNIRTLLKYEQKIITNSRRVEIAGDSKLVRRIPCLVLFDFIFSMFSTFEEAELAFLKINENSFEFIAVR